MIDISLVPKKEASKPFSINRLFSWISLSVLIASIIAGGLIIFMLISSKNNLVQLNQQLQELDKNINSQPQTIQFAQSVLMADQIIGSHKYPSKFLDFLEKNTNPFVQWTNLNVDLSSNTVDLNGSAHDLLVVAQQIKRLENSKVAFSIKLGNVKSENNKVSFKLSFSLDSSVLSAIY